MVVQKICKMSFGQFFTRVKNSKIHFLFNFSHPLLISPQAKKLLGLGIDFVPFPCNLPTFSDFSLDFKVFRQRLVFAYDRFIRFSQAPHPPNFVSPFFRFNAKFPPLTAEALDTHFFNSRLFLKCKRAKEWITSRENLIEDFFADKNNLSFPVKNNLSPSQRRLLSFIRSNPDICLNTTDKNLGTCVYFREDFEKEVFSQLNQVNFYELILDKSPEEIISVCFQNLSTLIKSFAKIIPPWLAEHLLAHGNKLSSFKIIFKIHKPNNPGRPIVPNIHWVTANISRFVDAQLQPYLKKQEIILSDSFSLTHFLDQFGEIPENANFFTFDVSSLYTNIDIEEGLTALHWFLETQTEFPPSAKECIEQFSRFILENNFFTFKKNIYKQIHGIAMGTPFAVSFANIFLLFLEKNRILHIFKPNLLVYKRYIDDAFGIWIGSQAMFFDFISSFSSRAKSPLVLTPVFDPSSVDFLDLTIFRSENRISYKLFKKILNNYLYFPYSSFHPNHTKKGFVKAELIRFLLRNKEKVDFLSAKTFFYRKLRDRGFPPWFLEDIFLSIQWKDKPFYYSRSVSKKESPSMQKDNFKGCIFVLENHPALDSFKRFFDFTVDEFIGSDDDFFPFPSRILLSTRNPKKLGPILHLS